MENDGDGGAAYYARAQRLAAAYREDAVARILALLEEAAAYEHPAALHALGTWHHYGIGVPHDDVRAAALWARSSEAGDPGASLDLAIACERGIGVAPDPARAFALYERALRAGSVDACYEIGRCLHYGIGRAAPDPEGARDYFERARAFGHAEAACDAAEGDAPRRMPRPNVAGPFHATRGGGR